MRQLISLFFFIYLVFFSEGCTGENKKITGIKIYDYNGNYEVLASEWRHMGINTCFAGSGLTGNPEFRKALKKNKIKTFLIFPVFQNPEILKKDTSLYALTDNGMKAVSDWVEFVCPSRKAYRASKIKEAADLIRKYNPDGISIDFIRHFVYWEMIYPDTAPENLHRACYCDSCLALFSTENNVVIPDSCLTTVQKATFIDKNCPDRWNEFRCKLITSMVKEISDEARRVRPGIKINVHAVPWREIDFNGAGINVAGQDLRSIAPFTDYISPMCYSQMLKRDPEWISDVVRDMDRRCRGKILPSIQVYPEYIDRKFTSEDFGNCLNESLKPPSLGVVFFSWPLFVKDSSRIDVARKIIK